MRKIFPVVAAGATTMALAAGTFGYAMIDKVVTLTVDGQVQTVHTAADTVGALLAEQGISTGSHDAIAPAPASSLADGNRISVAFGRPVTLSIDGAPQTRWTLATDVRSALFDFGVDPTGAVLSASPAASISRSGTTVAISTPKAVTVSIAGKTQRVVITGRSVADALAAAKVRTDGDDLMSVGSVERGQQATAETTVQDGSKVTVTQVVTKTTTKRILVAYAVQRQDSKDLTKGTTKVQTPGTAGSAKVTYREVWRDGKRASRKKIKTTVVTKAKSQLVLVGTKEAEKAAPVAGGGVWDKIAKCESGGNWSINTGNGFYGGLQFSLGTWRANGGSGKPNQASRAAQIAVAKRVQKSQGWGAWPGCTRKLGLR